MLTLLDLDPNIVKPGWTPLLITIALGGVMVLLFISLRKQFRTIEKNFPAPEPGATARPGATPASGAAPADSTATSTATSTDSAPTDAPAPRV